MQRLMVEKTTDTGTFSDSVVVGSVHWMGLAKTHFIEFDLQA